MSYSASSECVNTQLIFPVKMWDRKQRYRVTLQLCEGREKRELYNIVFQLKIKLRKYEEQLMKIRAKKKLTQFYLHKVFSAFQKLLKQEKSASTNEKKF